MIEIIGALFRWLQLASNMILIGRSEERRVGKECA